MCTLTCLFFHVHRIFPRLLDCSTHPHAIPACPCHSPCVFYYQPSSANKSHLLYLCLFFLLLGPPCNTVTDEAFCNTKLCLPTLEINFIKLAPYDCYVYNILFFIFLFALHGNVHKFSFFMLVTCMHQPHLMRIWHNYPHRGTSLPTVMFLYLLCPECAEPKSV